MADTSERINIGRAKLVMGFALLAIGLIITSGVLYDIQSEQGDFRQAASGTQSPFSSWRPSSYEILRVPDYLLGYLMLGVFITTVGITILVPPLLKRFAGIEDD